MTIGQLLRKARESTGLTQVEFAKKSKVSQSAISSLESSERDLKLSMIQRWAKACNLSVSELLEGLK